MQKKGLLDFVLRHLSRTSRLFQRGCRLFRPKAWFSSMLRSVFRFLSHERCVNASGSRPGLRRKTFSAGLRYAREGPLARLGLHQVKRRNDLSLGLYTVVPAMICFMIVSVAVLRCGGSRARKGLNAHLRY